jgi:phosphotransacetylase/acyl dehydratase
MPKLDGNMALIENRTFDELSVGDSASVSRTVTKQDIELFAVVSGDVNPAHLDTAYAEAGMFQRVIAHGMLGAGLISSVLGTRLPGPGTIYLGQDLRFRHPVGIGDTVTATVTVREKHTEKWKLLLDCVCTNQDGRKVITGTAEVIAPTEKVSRPRVELPQVRLSRHESVRNLLARAAGQPPVPTAVVYPADAGALGAVVRAAAPGLIAPILVGPAGGIHAAAAAAGLDPALFRVVEADSAAGAAALAVGMVHAGDASMLMTGSLHAAELMLPVLAPGTGLRTGRRLSHIYLMDIPGYPRPVMLTDTGVNIAPDLTAKCDIIQNAIDLAHVMGVEQPRVALLSAMDTINPKIRSTLDAGVLCKMADRGQITGGLLDGPLGADTALNLAAAEEGGIASPVAGRADILVAPDLESGTMLAKQLICLLGADAAGVVLGARVPIVVTSRADTERMWMASCAVAAILARALPPAGVR